LRTTTRAPGRKHIFAKIVPGQVASVVVHLKIAPLIMAAKAISLSIALASAAAKQASWQIIAPAVGTEVTGVAFNEDAKTGFTAGSVNGVGASVLKSVDSGR
jgi:hypothetical protein